MTLNTRRTHAPKTSLIDCDGVQLTNTQWKLLNTNSNHQGIFYCLGVNYYHCMLLIKGLYIPVSNLYQPSQRP